MLTEKICYAKAQLKVDLFVFFGMLRKQPLPLTKRREMDAGMSFERSVELSGIELLRLADQAASERRNEEAARLIALAFKFFDAKYATGPGQAEAVDCSGD